MGTRHGLIVKFKGKTKVSQYGQWDGYLSGQGMSIAKFLQASNLKFFKTKIEKLKKYTAKEVEDKWVQAGAKRNSVMVPVEVADRLEDIAPELSRNTGADILKLIRDQKVDKVKISDIKAVGDLGTEFIYTLDLDKDTITVEGHDKILVYPLNKWTVELVKKLSKKYEK